MPGMNTGSECSLFLVIVLAVSTLSAIASNSELDSKRYQQLSRDRDMQGLSVRYIHWMIAFAVAPGPNTVRRVNSHQFDIKGDAPYPFTASRFLTKIGGSNVRAGLPNEIECRWLFIVTNSSGKAVSTLYANTAFTEAWLDGVLFEPDEDFRAWVDEKFRTRFELEDTLCPIK